MDTELVQTNAGRLWAVVAALAAGLVLAAATGRSETQTQVVEECPNHGSHTETFTLPGQITNIPEFHDCQRFMIDGRTYDSVYAIFARFRLDTVTFPSRVQCYREVPAGPVRVDSTSGLRVARTGIALLDTTGRGLVDADGRVRVDSTGTSLLNPDSSVRGEIVHCREVPGLVLTRIGIPVALIRTWGGRYRPLGIDLTFNCLYLSHQLPLGWSAKMVPVRGEGDCLPREVNLDTLRGTVLTVFPRVGLGFRDDDFPPVARWDRDPRHGLYYVGVRCGGAWCEVGATRTDEVPAIPSAITAPSPVLVSSPNYKVPGAWFALPSKYRRVFEIKGWYDEQYLAVRTPQGMRPSGILGTVFPDSGLYAVSRRDYTTKTWILTAHVALSQSSADLKNKLNLEQAPVLGVMNRIYLCAGPVTKCIPAESQATMDNLCKGAKDNMDPASHARWWARIVAAGTGQVAYRCVKRTAHTDMRLPGTTRWSWDKTNYDDPIWAECDDGCCKVS